MSFTMPRRGLACSVAIVLLCIGCGRAGHDRCEVGGLVSLDGAPLPAGMTIKFTPQGGESPVACGATDARGHYIMYAEQGKIGVFPGVYAVSVERPLEDIPGPYTGPPELANVNIPTAYQTGKSKLRFTAPADGSTFDITMQSE